MEPSTSVNKEGTEQNVLNPDELIIKKKIRGGNTRTKDDDTQSQNENSQVIIQKKETSSLLSATTKKSQKSNSINPIITADRNITTGDQGATTTVDTDGNMQDFTRDKERKSTATAAKRGPVRAHSSIHVSNQFDYKPDVCKDYFETGFCGWGDNCKFAHIREDYKKGWEIDLEYEESKKKQRDGEEITTKKVDGEGDLPFACYICRLPFVDPVVTKCKHYFCEKCAIKEYNFGKNPKCAVCKKDTGGIFNTAHEILKRKKLKQ
jgi:RING finger protein 113A